MKTIFWNMNTQNDFFLESGTMYIKGIEKIIPNLERLTEFAKENNYQIINSGDSHTLDSSEFIENGGKFPRHCIRGSVGAEFIKETNPENPYVVDFDEKSYQVSVCKIENSRSLLLSKNNLNVFTGNPYADYVLDTINPDRVIIYGFAAEHGIDYALKKLVSAKKQVYVPIDAIKEISKENLDNLFRLWSWNGVNLTNTNEVIGGLEWLTK